jgi:hypothetical protein
MIKKVNFQILSVFIVIYFCGFFLLRRLYALILIKCFSDVVINLNKPNINQKRVIYFVQLVSFEKFIIVAFLAFVVVWFKVFKPQIYRESMISFLVFLAVMVTISLIFPGAK